MSLASACKTSTTQNHSHQISNTQRTEKKTTDVVIQQHSRKLLILDILMSETFWAHKKWNKIASDIKLVFYCSALVIKDSSPLGRNVVPTNNYGRFVILARHDVTSQNIWIISVLLQYLIYFARRHLLCNRAQ